MNSQELRALQEAYSQVYELDEAAIYKRGGKGQTTETPLQIYGKGATAREKKKLHNIPKGRIGADEVGDYDRGSGNAAKRRVAALTKPEAKKFPNRLTRSDNQGIKDSYDLYDIILSHLLDEGYASTEEAADKIILNMSESWFEDIMERRENDEPGEEDSRSDVRSHNRAVGYKSKPKQKYGSYDKRDRGGSEEDHQKALGLQNLVRSIQGGSK
jgi:hypothetical protein